MIKNYLLITIRSLMKNKLFILINVFGMGLAIACCIVSYLNWDFANKWDETQVNADHIYRVQFWREFQQHSERHGMAPMPLGNHIKDNFRNVNRVVRLNRAYSDMRIGDEIFGTQMAFVDSGYFDLFSYTVLHGDLASVKDKSRILISEKLAKKYFNRIDVSGEPLTQIVLGQDGVRRPKEFIIGAVFKDLPMNSSFFEFDAIAYWDNYWDINLDKTNSESSWKRWNTLFLQIDDPAQVPLVEKQLTNYIEPQNQAREDFKVTRYYLENLAGMARRSREAPRLNDDWLGGGVPAEAISVPIIMSGLLLLLACFNFTNTSIAISSRRLKEIGIRKVMGGMRQQLIAQFLGENLLLCMLGLLAGLLMAEWLVPAYDKLWPWIELHLSYTENAGFLLFLVGLLLLTAIIAGSYPALYITSFEPVSILKGTARFGGTNWFTRILLGGQFVISLLSIVMGMAFYRNGDYQKNYDLGFSTHGSISAWVGNEAGYDNYRNALAGNPDIKEIAGTRNHIATSFYNDPVKYESTQREVDILDVGDQYASVMDMTLVDGRWFQKDSETDKKESVVVTEEFVKQFGWKDSAIGKRVVWMDTVTFYVVGVVKRVYARALWQPIQPMMFRYAGRERYEQLIVKTDPAKMAEVNAFMEKKWKEVFPNTMYNGVMIDRELRETNEVNANVMIMFGFLGFFAALMTGIGLYTLVSLNIVRRMKEIGVRKVLGASVASIAGVINQEFIINLGIATVIGATLGSLGANALMDSIWEYYLSVGAIVIGSSVLIMVALALSAAGFKSVRTASLNPVKTLRDE